MSTLQHSPPSRRGMAWRTRSSRSTKESQLASCYTTPSPIPGASSDTAKLHDAYRPGPDGPMAFKLRQLDLPVEVFSVGRHRFGSQHFIMRLVDWVHARATPP